MKNMYAKRLNSMNLLNAVCVCVFGGNLSFNKKNRYDFPKLTANAPEKWDAWETAYPFISGANSLFSGAETVRYNTAGYEKLISTSKPSKDGW